MVSFVSGLPAPPRASTGNENQLTLLLVGTPGSGKRTFAQALLAAGKEETGQTLTVRTRETLLQSQGSTASSPAGSADFLLLLVNSTSSTALDELEATLSVLPTGWWSYTAILVTKTDQRAKRSAELLDVVDLRKRYDPSMPVLYSSPSALQKTAGRVHRLVSACSTGTTSLKLLRKEQVLAFDKARERPGGIASAV